MFSSLPYLLMFTFSMFFGASISVSSSHWLGMWAGAEINLIGFIPLIIYSGLISESESAVKYFIFQATGSSFLVLGSLLAFGMTLTWEVTHYSGLAALVMAGLAMKLGAAPFHWWLPSVMAGMAWPAAFILTTWQKVIPLFLIMSLISPSLVLILSILSVSSALVGGIGGLNQTQMRAIVAYSSIGHMGWLLFSLTFSFSAVIIYFLIYVLISLTLFHSMWMMNNSSVMALGENSRFMPCFSAILSLLSIGGLPPFLGFIPKWFVFIQSQESNMFLLMLILILGSLFSVYYYLILLFSLLLSNKTKKYDSSYILIFSILLNCIGGSLILCLF